MGKKKKDSWGFLDDLAGRSVRQTVAGTGRKSQQNVNKASGSTYKGTAHKKIKK